MYAGTRRATAPSEERNCAARAGIRGATRYAWKKIRKAAAAARRWRDADPGTQSDPELHLSSMA
jgi:hypothetical protein